MLLLFAVDCDLVFVVVGYLVIRFVCGYFLIVALVLIIGCASWCCYSFDCGFVFILCVACVWYLFWVGFGCCACVFCGLMLPLIRSSWLYFVLCFACWFRLSYLCLCCR